MTNEKTLEGKIKVLLVEDKDEHVSSSTFPEDVEVTRVKTYVEAINELYGTRGGEYNADAIDFLKRNPKRYDVILTDMNFPVGTGFIAGNSSTHETLRAYGMEIDQIDDPKPLGWPLIFVAQQVGIKKIGLYTDTNHHQGIMALALDPVSKQKRAMGDTQIAIWDVRSTMEKNTPTSYRIGPDQKGISVEADNAEYCITQDSDKTKKNYGELFKYLARE